jgi:hypothetical protein
MPKARPDGAGPTTPIALNHKQHGMGSAVRQVGERLCYSVAVSLLEVPSPLAASAPGSAE